MTTKSAENEQERQRLALEEMIEDGSITPIAHPRQFRQADFDAVRFKGQTTPPQSAR